jgi:hypothetical protein
MPNGKENPNNLASDLASILKGANPSENVTYFSPSFASFIRDRREWS